MVLPVYIERRYAWAGLMVKYGLDEERENEMVLAHAEKAGLEHPLTLSGAGNNDRCLVAHRAFHFGRRTARCQNFQVARTGFYDCCRQSNQVQKAYCADISIDIYENRDLVS
jgi:hypothetical protein